MTTTLARAPSARRAAAAVPATATASGATLTRRMSPQCRRARSWTMRPRTRRALQRRATAPTAATRARRAAARAATTMPRWRAGPAMSTWRGLRTSTRTPRAATVRAWAVRAVCGATAAVRAPHGSGPAATTGPGICRRATRRRLLRRPVARAALPLGICRPPSSLAVPACRQSRPWRPRRARLPRTTLRSAAASARTTTRAMWPSAPPPSSWARGETTTAACTPSSTAS
mmetsp:Transcript_9135/g.25099  ORF Transcript_9135/g.25099 Transcript_9135/m.25099 type:complete len:230 (-) Transcript_9135:1205-1894(-)